MPRFDVTNYNFQLFGEANNPNAYNSFIGLNLVETNVPVASQASAFLLFYPEGTTPLPDNVVEIQGGIRVYSAYFHEHWFASAIDLLRNEAPVFFFFDDATRWAGLGTGTQEPVGEGE